MARQAKRQKRRKPAPRAVLKMSRILARRLLTVFTTVTVMAAVALVLGVSLDRPIEEITVDAPFNRVTTSQISEAVGSMNETGFLSVDLSAMRARIEALEWVDKASVRRVWPDRLYIAITEQMPAARWGEHGLLNVRGELFVQHARHEFAELPRLSGPDSRVTEVASKYLALNGPTIEAGLGGLKALRLEERGSWHLILHNGIEVRLGRRDVEARVDRFLNSVTPLLVRKADQIRYVDMRYTNGFAIGWSSEQFKQQALVEASAMARESTERR
ncbi:MAG: cell division protein FtsQ/DivIB [Pseudomonadota bacterium]